LTGSIALRRVTVSACDGPFGSAIKSDHYVEAGARVIRLGNLGAARWLDQDAVYLDLHYWRSLSGHHAQAGDLVIAGLGDESNPVGRATAIPDLGPAIVKADCYRLRLKASVVEPRFVAWYLSSGDGLTQSARLADGATRPRLTLDKALSMRVPAFPLIRQREIASFLDRETARIDSLVGAKRRMIELLRDRRSASLECAIEAGQWERRRLSSLLTRIDQGWSPQCENRPAEAGEWGVLKVGCVNGGRFRPQENKALPLELSAPEEHLIRPGDLLMSRANTTQLLGSAALVEVPVDRRLLCDKLFRLRVREDVVLASFLVYALATPRVRSLIELGATGASDSMQNIGQDTVRDLEIPVPPLDEQARIVHYLDARRLIVDRTSALLATQLNLLAERRQALITAAVTGQLPIPGIAA
jgi:type I restriction enzyme S subunit